MKRIVVLVIMSLASVVTYAAGETGYAHIVSTASASNLGNHVYIKISLPPSASWNSPPAACSSHPTWNFTLSLDTAWGKNIYAMLLAAQAAGTTVWLSGTGQCSQDETVESLRAINTYN